jgi:hypothetical protein
MASVQLKNAVSKQWRPRYDSRCARGARRAAPRRACAAARPGAAPAVHAAAARRPRPRPRCPPPRRSRPRLPAAPRPRRRGVSAEEKAYMRQHVLDLISQDDSKARREAAAGVGGPTWPQTVKAGLTGRPTAGGGPLAWRLHHTLSTRHAACDCALNTLAPRPHAPPPPRRSPCRWRSSSQKSPAATTPVTGRGWCLTCSAARRAAARSRCAAGGGRGRSARRCPA